MADKTFDLSILFKMVDRFSAPLKQSMHNFNKWSDQVRSANSVGVKFGQNMRDIGSKMSLYVSAPMALAGGVAVKTAMDFESAFTGVRKTVNASEQEIQGLKSALEKLPRKIPLLQEEIFGIAEAAGQLGIETKNIPKFAEVMANLGATTDLSSIQGAQALAKFANVMKMSQQDFDRLGSSVSYLGNTLATNESSIVEMASRLTGMSSLIGLSSAEVMGLAGAMSQLGIQAEAGGSSMSQVMMRINKEIGTNSAKIKAFAKISGQSLGEFESLWKKDAMEAILLFSNGLSKLNDSGKNVNLILDALGMDGMRVSEVLLKMASASDKTRTAIEDSKKAWEENNATIKEAALRYGTAESKLKILWNVVRSLADSFGTLLLPSIKMATEWLIPLVDWFKNLDPVVKKIIVAFGAAVAILGPLILALGAVTGFITFMIANASVAGIIAGIGAAFVTIGAAVAFVISYLAEIEAFFTSIPDKVAQFAAAIEKMAIFVYDKLTGMIPKFDIIPDWAKNLFSGSGEEGQSNKSLVEQANQNQKSMNNKSLVEQANQNQKSIDYSSINKSTADINIKVSSEDGSSAKVEKVTKKGNPNLKVINDSYLGAGAAYGF